MEEIGNLFLLTREAAGISLKEVSEDLEIEEAILENIESGKSGAFTDIFVLKNYISDYAKYLGLDFEKIIDEFNEYIFEATSKIPIKEIEKQILAKEKEEEGQEKVVSPYTKFEKKVSGWLYAVIYIIIVLCIIASVFWSVKEITINSRVAQTINYRK